MPLSFAQLSLPLTLAQLQALLLNVLQGLGVVVGQSATAGIPLGTGTLSLTGTPNNSYSLLVKIVAGGELGVGTFQYATDGATYSAIQTIPAGGTFLIPNTGVSIVFTPGPVGAGVSFGTGDIFSAPLASPNFPVTSWQPGSVPRTLVNVDAQVLASFSAFMAQVISGGLAQFATGPWADLLGQNVYNLNRIAAVAAIGLVTLNDVQSAGPFTITPGSIVLQANNGQQYTNNNGGTLTKGGTLQLNFQALIPGAAANVGIGQIQTLATPLPGVTCNNPDFVGGSTWITTSGADAESDAAYMTRCMLRWPSLGIGATAATYSFWAQSVTGLASPVTRSFAQTDAVQAGKVNVYIANATGGSVAGDVTLVQAYINSKAPLTVLPNVIAAANVVQAVTATINFFIAKTTQAAVQAAATAALNALINGLAIGTDNVPSTKLYVSQVIAALQNIAGVRNVVVSVPAADIGINLGQVLTVGVYTLTVTGV